ncbi:MAG: hypothetical protein FAF03_00995, partial [Epsilonproteobacteria bacterium]|nr:hypothetical protein [Campylobacterota bacterium]
YLLSYKTILDKKKEVRENKMLWYSLYRPAKKHIHEFTNEKIFYNQIGHTIDFCLDRDGYYCNDKLYFITSSNVNLPYLVAVFNSKIMRYYFSQIFNFGGGKGKDTFLDIPIPKINEENKKLLIDNANILLDLNKTLQTKKTKFLKRLKENFSLDKLSKKLEAFYEYDFKTFVAELKKKKIKLSLVEQDEWEEYFEAYQKELLDLQSQIDTTDKQIDEMVYKLYGLNDEEIAVVENG